MLFIWNGGLGIWGALAGGLLGATLYLKRHSKDILQWLDILFVTVPLGQSIGRWGNYFNKEIYGPITNLPWGIYINGERRHPLFLYESLLNLGNFAVLFFLFTKTRLHYKKGFFTTLYVFNYSVIRFCMELLRTDHWFAMGLNVSLLIPILLFIGSLLSLVILFRSNP